MGKFWNRVKNTVGIVPRSITTAGRAIIDTTKAALNLVLDPFVGLGKTGTDIKQAIHKSFTEGPWYHKLRKVPTTLALTPFMAIEGAVETLRGTGVNACSSARDIVGNNLRNKGTAIKMMGRAEEYDFKTEKLEYKKVSPKNRLASLFKPETIEDKEKKILKDREKALKAREDKFRKYQEDELSKMKADRDNWQNIRKQENERINKENTELRKRNSELEQKDKVNEELIATLKKPNTEVSGEKEKKAEVVKLNPKTEKKENSGENKEAKIIKMDTKPEEKAETKGEPKEAKVVKLEPKEEEKPEIKPEKKTEAKSETKEKGEKSENTEKKEAA